LVAVDPLVNGHILFNVLDITVADDAVRAPALVPMIAFGV
jgi:hypothetical protein